MLVSSAPDAASHKKRRRRRGREEAGALDSSPAKRRMHQMSIASFVSTKPHVRVHPAPARDDVHKDAPREAPREALREVARLCVLYTRFIDILCERSRDLPVQFASSFVHDAAWSPDTLALAVNPSADENLVVVLDWKTPARVFFGHTGAVEAVSWASGGEILASGGADGLVCVWKPRVAVQRQTVSMHSGRKRQAWIFDTPYETSPMVFPVGSKITCLAWARDAPILAVGDATGSVSILDVSTEAWTHEVSVFPKCPVSCLAWGPDNFMLAVGAAEGACVRVIDVTKDYREHTAFHTEPNKSSAFDESIDESIEESIDESIEGLAWSGPRTIVWACGRTVFRGHLSSGSTAARTEPRPIKMSAIGSHDGPVRSISVSKMGTVASASWVDGVRVWNADTGALVKHVHGGPRVLPWTTWSPPREEDVGYASAVDVARSLPESSMRRAFEYAEKRRMRVPVSKTEFTGDEIVASRLFRTRPRLVALP